MVGLGEGDLPDDDFLLFTNHNGLLLGHEFFAVAAVDGLVDAAGLGPLFEGVLGHEGDFEGVGFFGLLGRAYEEDVVDADAGFGLKLAQVRGLQYAGAPTFLGHYE